MDSAKKLNAEDVIKYDADFLRAFKEVRIPMGKQLKKSENSRKLAIHPPSSALPLEPSLPRTHRAPFQPFD